MNAGAERSYADREWECVIGLEVHVQLALRTKLFSGCPYDPHAAPNEAVDAVSLGLPGTLPVPSREAVHAALRLADALDASIAEVSAFARKHYTYPDLPRNYQITQYEHPLARGGHLEFEHDDRVRTLALERLHLEEDAGRSTHDERTLVDLDRAGVALVEIVTTPGLRSAAEASDALVALQELVRWLGVSEARMELGQMRCDVNVSVRRGDDSALGTKVEIKNLNSRRHVRHALELEVQRQIDEITAGRKVRSQTRGYDPSTRSTYLLREKEEEPDYRYLPEPDLPPLRVDAAWRDRVRAARVEGPVARRQRLAAAFGFDAEDLRVVVATPAGADRLEAVLAAGAPPRRVMPWIRGELTRIAQQEGARPEDLDVDPRAFAELLRRVDDGSLPSPLARDVLADLVRSGAWPDLLRGELRPPDDDGPLRAIVRDVLAEHPEQVATYRAGKHGLLGWFTARVRERADARTDPRRVRDLLREELSS